MSGILHHSEENISNMDQVADKVDLENDILEIGDFTYQFGRCIGVMVQYISATG